MFAWGKIVVAEVIFIACTVINVDASFISYKASGSVVYSATSEEATFFLLGG